MPIYKDNPWNELNPYSEGQPIYGRNQIISKLVDAIYTNLQTILYGKSGIGKTSLLQAGCFPELRKKHFFPIIIRPGIMESSNNYAMTVKNIICDSAKEVIPGIKPSLHSVEVGSGIFTENLLCQFLYSTKFLDDRGDIYIPILIFDQFEEFLNNKKIYATALSFVKELYVLLDNTISIPSGFLDYSNYRMVFALREDYLYCLEDIVDHYNLDELRFNRHRITALTDKQAQNVIEKTFRSTINNISSDDLTSIANIIIPAAKGHNQDADIRTPILSLLGSLTYKHLTTGKAISSINLEHEVYLYYDGIMAGIPLAVRSYLEEKLITEDGRRDSVDYESALRTERINEEQIEFLVKDKKILRIVEAGSEEKRIEFSHDTVCKALKPVIEMRNSFYEKGFELNLSSFDNKEKQPEIVSFISYAADLGHLEAHNLLERLYIEKVNGTNEDKEFRSNNPKKDRLSIILSGGNWPLSSKTVKGRKEEVADVFLSYSRQDLGIAQKLSEELQSIGCKVWMDVSGIESGEKFMDSIVDAIKSSKIFLFLASSNSYHSQFAIRELQFAEHMKIRTVIILIDDSPMPGEFTFMYGRKDTININNEVQKNKLFKDLKRYVDDNLSTDKYNGLEYTKIMIGDYQIVMIRVEGGLFNMGATLQQGGENEDERTVHSVRLDSYYMAQIPVTQELWQAVMGTKDQKWQSANNDQNKNLPVVNVNWNECAQFVEKLNVLTGKEFRLPTEAEWEYAAKGGVNGRMNGFKYSGGNNLHNVSWNEENSGGQIQKVAQKKPNELGIYDMSGNVWEWCFDWYASYPKGQVENPKGPDFGEKKVCRGGSWASKGKECRISIRESEFPDESGSDIGFRLVL